MVLAHFKHLGRKILRNVEVKQFLTQIKPLAAVFHALCVLVDLEEEKYVMFVDFVVVLLDKVVDVLLYLAHLFS